MRIHVDNPGRLRQLLQDLGVPDDKLGEATRRVRAENAPGLTRRGAVQPGTTLEVPDELFPDGFVVRRRGEPAVATVDASLAGAPGGVQKMGALGTHNLEAPASSKAEPRGPLSALSLMDLPLQAIDGGQLTVDMPLKPGTWRVATPDGQLEVGVRPGGRLSVEVEIGQGPRGPVIKAGQVRLKPPLVVENAGDLVKGIPFAGLATRLARPEIEALRIGADGSLSPRFGAFGMKGLGVPLSDVVLPRVETDIARMLEGSMFQSGGLLPAGAMTGAAQDRLDRLDLGALLGSLGAMSEQGRFHLDLRGHAGRIDVRGDQVTLGRDGGPFTLSLGGEIGADQTGAIKALIDAQASSDLGAAKGRFQLDGKAEGQRIDGTLRATGEASPGAGKDRIGLELDDDKTSAQAGDLSAQVTDEGVTFQVRGELAELIKDAGGKAWLRLGEGVAMRLQGRALASAQMRFSLERDHLVVSDGKVSGKVELDGGQAEKGLYGIQLDKGAALSFSADAEAELHDGRLTLAADEVAVGVQGLSVKSGPVSAPVENGTVLTAQGSLTAQDGSADGSMKVKIDARSRPKLGFLRSPVRGGAKGSIDVKLEGGRLTVSDDLKIGLR